MIVILYIQKKQQHNISAYKIRLGHRDNYFFYFHTLNEQVFCDKVQVKHNNYIIKTDIFVACQQSIQFTTDILCLCDLQDLSRKRVQAANHTKQS